MDILIGIILFLPLIIAYLIPFIVVIQNLYKHFMKHERINWKATLTVSAIDLIPLILTLPYVFLIAAISTDSGSSQAINLGTTIMILLLIGAVLNIGLLIISIIFNIKEKK